MYKHTIYTSYVQYATCDWMSCATAKDNSFLMFVSINNLDLTLMTTIDKLKRKVFTIVQLDT
jgi:hypothetical protein